MHIKRSNAIYIPQAPGMQGVWEKIEQGGRTCYKSEGKTVYDKVGHSLTAESFAHKLIGTLRHLSVAEHAGVYFEFPIYSCEGKKRFGENDRFRPFFTDHDIMKHTKYKIIKDCDGDKKCYISTNYRVIVEHGLEGLMKYMCPPSSRHDPIYSIRVFTDRGVSAELNRHRVNSPSERSTRYVDSRCGLKILVPDFIKDEVIEDRICRWTQRAQPNEPVYAMYKALLDGEVFDPLDWYLFANYCAELSYRSLRENGWQKQEARCVLPLGIETELLISAHESDWKHFFDLRLKGTTGEPHPQMKLLARQMAEEFERVLPWLQDYPKLG